MQRFQRRNFLRRIIYSWPVVLVLTLLFIFIGRATFHAYLRARIANQTYLGVRQEREELSGKQDALEKKLTYLSSPYGLKKELRQRFSVKKPDEKLIIIIDRPISESETPSEESVSRWKNFLDVFRRLILIP